MYAPYGDILKNKVHETRHLSVVSFEETPENIETSGLAALVAATIQRKMSRETREKGSLVK